MSMIPPKHVAPTAVLVVVREGLRRLATVYQRSAAATGDTADVLEVYAGALRDLEPEAIATAVQNLINESKFFPKPAEWRAAARTVQRALYESRMATVQPVKQYGVEEEPDPPTHANGRLLPHMVMVFLSIEHGPSLERIGRVDPDHAADWQEMYALYQSSKTPADWPTMDNLGEFLHHRGADLRILRAALERVSGGALAQYGIITPRT